LVVTKEVSTDPTVDLEKRFLLLKPVAVRVTRYAGGTCIEEILLPDVGDQKSEWIQAVVAEPLLSRAKARDDEARWVSRALSRLKIEVPNSAALNPGQLRLVRLSNKDWDFHPGNPDRDSNIAKQKSRREAKSAQESGDSKAADA
jgi:hypothetical protein